jgi:multicomponent K+:H+ antiporter subunit D
MLLVVFAVKAALLPLYFWLPDTYAAASAPVAALFAIMTKVGVYAIARTSTLLLGPEAAAGRCGFAHAASAGAGHAGPGGPGGAGRTQLRLLIAYTVVASAGTLLLAIGLGTATRWPPACST